MKYRKKPVVIEAVEWTGTKESFEEIEKFMGDFPRVTNGLLHVDTLEGTMYASVGDYIIKGVKGEFYPCKPDIFKATYEAVE